jgi:predicted nucleotidyltransferase
MTDERTAALEGLLRRYDVAAAYLFGSRADDGLRSLAGEALDGSGSDLDVAVRFRGGLRDFLALSSLQMGLDDLFEPLRVDLVPMERLDALFQARAIDGHRIFAADATEADLYELYILNRAADLLPLQRAREQEIFGVFTS